MSTTITINFNAGPGGFDLNSQRFWGPPNEVASEHFKSTEPAAWVAAHEFLKLGTTSGVITITAV